MEQTNARAEKAAEYKQSMNCAQAVLMAYQEELGKTKEELMALGDAFGLGMGGMEATCGALTGAAIVLGLLNNKNGKPSEPSKMLMNRILRDFAAEAGATRCRDLKGIGTGKVLCACDDCVRIAVRNLEKTLSVRA